jgi:hypothetical protein
MRGAQLNDGACVCGIAELVGEAVRQKRIVQAPDHQRWRGYAAQTRLPLRPYPDCGTVKCENACPHSGIEMPNRFIRRIFRHLRLDEFRRKFLEVEILHPLLALTWRLPDLGEIVPRIFRVDRPTDAGPGPHQIRPDRRQTACQKAAPVMADQIYGFANLIDPVDQPVEILFLC